ncbi:MAG: hypothetical protein NTZ16_10445 [Verrucomicrobia bacterium]|nr:hypothetical protein [Verrucomicrobiota bacterium]
MELKATSLLTTLKNVSAFGIKYATDFPAASVGGRQFALVTAAVPATSGLGSQQVSGGADYHAAALDIAAGRLHLHDDLLAIADAAHSLVLMGNSGLAGKFLMPHSNGDQALLNTARAFQTEAVAISAQLIELGLAADFLTHLAADIADFESAITAKGAGLAAQGGATGGIAAATRQAAIALHVLDTVVSNTYKKRPCRARRKPRPRRRRNKLTNLARTHSAASPPVCCKKTWPPLAGQFFNYTQSKGHKPKFCYGL